MPAIISPAAATIMGVVEGLTEFLPVSSTGHLILTAHWLGLEADDPATKAGVDAFEIVIQSGALLAVCGLYAKSIRSMALGLAGRDPAGRSLFLQLIVAFLPAAVVGLLAGGWIKGHLFGVWPVVGALAAGGVLMLVVEVWRKRHATTSVGAFGQRSVAEVTITMALLIGCAQCLAMWPGTSRSMITMVAALLLGLSPKAAAEFSFLLALPTLGAATAYDLMKHGQAIIHVTGALGLLLGFVVSCVVAWLAIKGFLAYLTRHGMAVFGWYRLALALVLILVLRS